MRAAVAQRAGPGAGQHSGPPAGDPEIRQGFAECTAAVQKTDRLSRMRQEKAMPRSIQGTFEPEFAPVVQMLQDMLQDRKSTRLNSSHVRISYAVFCLKKKKIM